MGKNLISTAPYATDGGLTTTLSVASEELMQMLADTLTDEKAEYLLLKTRMDLFGTFGQVIIDRSYATFMLDLREGMEATWKNQLETKVRNQTRKGLNNPLDVRYGQRELVDDFFEVISTCWRDLGTPAHSKTLFIELLKCFDQDASLMVIYLKNKPVSAALLFLCKNTIHHPFAATIKRYNHLAINNVLYWKIIEFACQHEMEYFDMGRSPIGQGTYKYKSSWGAKPQQLYYNYLIGKKGTTPNYHSWMVKLATKTWSFMPLRLANATGPLFIKEVL